VRDVRNAYIILRDKTSGRQSLWRLCDRITLRMIRGRAGK
jgi:hypothetical protein